jgi:hypothetical protein
VSQNWTMSRVEQPVAEVQFQQCSHCYVVRENRIISHEALASAIFRGSAQDYDAQVYPSGLNGRGSLEVVPHLNLSTVTP